MRKAVLAVLAAVVTLAGCVSQSKYQALETRAEAERMALEQELKALKDQKRGLERELSGLRDEVARREAELARLKTAQEEQRETLERQLAALRDEVGRREAELAAVNDQLAAQRRELESEKERLQGQIAALNDQLAAAQRRAAELSAQKDEEIKRLRGTYDTLVGDLRREIAQGDIKISQVRDKLSVQLVEKILFDSGKTEIKPEGRDVLAKVANVLRSIDDKQIRIEGYTDSVPIGAGLRHKFPTNWELSAQRATTVLRFLEEKGGVDGKFLSAAGFGPHRPVASNDTPEGRAQNRRIEIVLTPLDLQDVLSELQSTPAASPNGRQ